MPARLEEMIASSFRTTMLLLACAATLGSSLFSQATDGNLVGTISDTTGASIPNAALELVNVDTGVQFQGRSAADGTYRFPNVLVGRYRLTATVTGFATASVQNINIELNKTATINLMLSPGTVQTTIEVVEAPTLIDTTTAQITSTYDRRGAIEIPTTAQFSGILNLSLLSAGVASAGGYGLGEGPSIGGQRPRQNNFQIEGVDNNRRDVTGPTVEIPNEAVQNFSLLQNQFSAEFGHSTGGQFNTVIRGGTNEYHGALYWYLQNRKLNAMDESDKRIGLTENPRFDENRLGGRIGGPIVRNKLFFFGNYEYSPMGEAGAAGAPILAPTALGYQLLGSIPGISRTNLDILRTYLDPAGTATDTTTVAGASIPIGVIPVQKPAYENNHRWLTSIDYNHSERDQFRGRYVDNRKDLIDTDAFLPVFFQPRPIRAKLAQFSWFRNFTPNHINELRLAYRRYTDEIPAGDFQFPGLDVFPNVEFQQDLQVSIGPNGVAPQTSAENGYQLVDNFNWVNGKHTLKFGVDVRRYIAQTGFVQRQRGDYIYSTVEPFLLDLTPDVLAQRNLGGAPYSGNATFFYWFVNDEIKLRPNFTLNLGLRHEYKGYGRDSMLQRLNASSSVPGVLEFREPKEQWKNFAPRVGIAWSPGTSGLTSIRAGFGMAYDVYFDNFGTLTKPPQLERTVDDDIRVPRPGYLANGGIRPDRRPDQISPEDARAFTSAYITDQQLPYSIQWNFGVQRAFAKDYTAEVRYLGTRGIHLYMQNQINVRAPVTAERHLPTLLQRPSQAELNAMPLTLNVLRAESVFLPQFINNGFESRITVFEPRGNSTYHGLATELTRRFSAGLMFKGAYTWSHAIDDSGADLFSTWISARRPQDFQNLRPERSTSLLDRRHRFTLSWAYDTPWFRTADNWALKNLVGNWIFSGLYTYESPQMATVQSGVDSNLNGDAAGDRVIVNPAGVPGTGSAVTPLNNSAGQTVAYLAHDPTAQYIVAGPGAYANGGRMTLPTNPINNFDLQFGKRFSINETKAVEFRASLWNAFNHPQFIPGRVSNVFFRDRVTTRNNLIPGNPSFDRHDLVYESNARMIQIGLRVIF
jgi:hypothetical protein